MLHVLTYIAVLVFVLAVAVRAIWLLRMPMHLRWELYPVPHEGGARARYGGSYFEEPEWWTQPRRSSFFSMLRYMLPEMLFLKALWDENRKMWYRSAPFHWGLYSLAGLAVLLILGALAQMAGVTIAANASAAGAAIHYLTIILGVASITLGVLGSAGLLLMRLTDEKLSDFTAPREIFNLAFILTAFVCLGLAFVAADRSYSILRGYVQGLITFDLSSVGSGWVATEIVVLSVLLAYIPLTHMSHFFVKWFTYHEVRWEDTPNRVGSKIERHIQDALELPVSWSAPHIKGDGRKTWAQAATEDITK